ncbi:hypothetical protein [Kocuria sp. SM24M-10]|nr:hypothetical protein [Kocuria sp. SM24M-10]
MESDKEREFQLARNDRHIGIAPVAQREPNPDDDTGAGEPRALVAPTV